MRNKKLYTLTLSNYRMPFYYDITNNIITSAANDIPMMSWPNGSWCLIANIYIIERLYKMNRSRKSGGGTLKTYAANLSHLIRFCYNNDVDFYRLTDNQFILFIRTISAERLDRDSSILARDANHVIAIGRVCLEFLNFVGSLYHNEKFVHPQGQIKADKKETVIKTSKNNNPIKIYCWCHNSFPTYNPFKKRSPITSNNIVKLHQSSVNLNNKNYFILKRRFLMLKLLEITGGRRIEIIELKVESVYAALRMLNEDDTKDPLLSFVTAKRRGNEWHERSIPLFPHDLELIREYIEINRAPLISRLIKSGKLKEDHGYVFISNTTGNQLKPNTITQEISILAKAADSTEQVCAQMFRHRFITKLFVDIIMEHKFSNPDNFRQALLDTEKVKRKVQQWTGHKCLSSLDHYIDLAFDEITDSTSVMNAVHLRNTTDSTRITAINIGQNLEAGLPIDEATSHLLKLIDSFQNSINRYGIKQEKN